MTEMLGVAEAKKRFSELIERVAEGERILVTRRGRPVLALVHPEDVAATEPRPKGLAAGAGLLADWEDFPEIMAEVIASRQKAKDRPPLDLE
jgi:prevent-host-death family protein